MADELLLGGHKFKSRFFLGTGKFGSKKQMQETILASGTELVTVALRRIDIEKHEENILSYIPQNIILMTNTSGARNAQEAIRIARLAREAGYGDWIKIEVINDSKYLLPDNTETLKAVEVLAAEGFKVLPYMHPDLYFARAMAKAGAVAIMPLGSLIGSKQGLQMKMMIQILINEIDLPIIVDAGIGLPSHAFEAMEMGSAAVLINTAVAIADDPPALAREFRQAIIQGRLNYLAKKNREVPIAQASSPLTGFLSNG